MADENLGTARGKLVIDGSQARDELKKTTASADDFRKGATKSGTAAATAFGAAAKGTAIAAVGVAGAFALAVNSAATFEQKLSGIQAVTGASAEDIERLRQKSLQLGKDTAFSASEAADAISELAKAGVSVGDIMSGAADATVALAAAGGVDLPEAATIASNAMNQFGLQAKDLPRVADLIAGAANSSAIDVHDLGESLKQVGAVANLAGVSFQDAAVAIAEMGNAGIKGSDAGTSLKTFLQNLIPQTKEQTELAKKLGIITKNNSNAFFDQNGKIKSLAQVSDVLKGALKGMTKEQKLNTLGILFGSDAIRAAAVLAEEGSAGFDKMAKSVGKVKAADVAKTRMDNLKGSIEQLKGSAETLAIVIGEQLQGILKATADGLNAFLGKVIEAASHIPELIAAAKALISEGLDKLRQAWNSDSVQRFVGAIQRLIAVLKGPLAALLGAVFSIAKKLAPFVSGALVVAFDLASRAMEAAADAAEFISRNWGTIKKIMVGVAAVMSPLVIVLTAQILALGVAALVSAGKQVLAWVLSGAAAVKNGAVMLAMSAKLIAQWIVAGATAVVNGAKIVIQWALMSARAVASVAIQLAQMALVIARWIVMGTVALAQGARIAAAWLLALGPIALIAAAVIAIVALIILNFDKIKGWITAAWNFLKKITGEAWNAIKNAVGTAISAVVGFFAALPGRILRALGSLASTLYNKGRELITGFLNGIKNAFLAVLGWLRGIAGLVGRAVSAAGTWLFSAGVALIQGFINGIKSMAGKVADAARGVMDAANGVVKRVMGINSPSTVYRDIGINVMKGYVLGIQKMQREALATTAAFARQMPTTFQLNATTGQLPSGTLRPSATAAAATAGGRTWSPTVVVNNAPPTTTAAQIQEGLRRAEALHSPQEALVG